MGFVSSGKSPDGQCSKGQFLNKSGKYDGGNLKTSLRSRNMFDNIETYINPNTSNIFSKHLCLIFLNEFGFAWLLVFSEDRVLESVRS